MKLTEIIKKNILAVVALATVIGFSSFKLWEKATLTEVTFRYEAPASDPYSEANVKSTANWSSNPACSDTEPDEVACSITVPIGNTLANGTQINPALVEIQTERFGTTGDNHKVVESLDDSYSNPINQALN